MSKIWKDYLLDQDLMEDLLRLMAEGKGRVLIERELNIPRRAVCSLMKYIRETHPDVDSQYQLMKSKQRFQDKNRVLNKVIRADIRGINAAEEISNTILSLLPEYEFNHLDKSGREENTEAVGIVQLADLHMNEVIDFIDTNYYNESNYDVISARLYEYAERIIKMFSAHDITNIIIANTGDALNSDRRLDEVTTNAENRSKALLISLDILSQFIAHLHEDFDVDFLTVCGNESRKYDDLTWSSRTFSNNYDFDIHYLLEHRMTDIGFLPITSTFETLINILGQNILFLHGQQLKAKDLDGSVDKVFSKYAKTGTLINYVITGHIHSTYISDFFSRSSGLIGDNSYSNNKLLTKSKAAQNVYIVTANSIDATSIDLQDYDLQKLYNYDRRFIEGSTQMKSRAKTKNAKRRCSSITF